MGIRSQPTRDSIPRGIRANAGKILLGASILAAMIYLFPLLAQAAPPTQGQTAFDAKCKSCHTIGGGKLVGPDLKGVADRRDRAWLIEFIVAPDQVIKRGDPIATQLVKEFGTPMPNMGVTQKDAEGILDYIAQQSGGAQGQASAGSAPVAAGNATAGQNLFNGGTSFQNGGVACIACHDIKGAGALGGGNIGRELSMSFTNLGEQGVVSTLQNTPFPGMKEAFAAHPLTAQEVADLTAFLRDASAGSTSVQAQTLNVVYFTVIGVIGFLVLLGIVNFIWTGRLRGVRQPLVKGGAK